ncbi:MAG: 50S ribosomal protein L4 [Clostridia bacterium]|nr:50S ribosomal protein L4 [Clostridia bacterium]
MPNLKVLNIKGETVGEVELSAEIFGIEINTEAMHRAVVQLLANERQGTQSALTRAEVRGGGRKPYRQKGTGRARQGSTRAPQFRHGGIVFAPKPRDYSFTLNKKEKRLAMKSVLTEKCQNNQIIVLDSLVLNEIKTKAMVEVLNNVNAGNSALVVMAEKNENVIKSSRNIPGVKTALVNTINVYDLLKYDNMVITLDALNKVQEVYR